MLVIWSRGYRLKKRVVHLVESAAQRIGLKRVDPKKGNQPDKTEKTSDEAEEQGINPESPALEQTTGVSPQISSPVSPQMPSDVSPQG
jgi:hypothetical protein